MVAAPAMVAIILCGSKLYVHTNKGLSVSQKVVEICSKCTFLVCSLKIFSKLFTNLESDLLALYIISTHKNL